jgi:hypothetical protein
VTHEDVSVAEVLAAVGTGVQGDPEAAKARLDTLWAQLGEHGDPLVRCVLAHFRADLCTDPRDELAWDLRALDASTCVTDTRARAHHPDLDIVAFRPSLHLNLAADHAKLGETAAARHHLALARAASDALSEDGLGGVLRAGIARLERELGVD